MPRISSHPFLDVYARCHEPKNNDFMDKNGNIKWVSKIKNNTNG